jgi:hypothetical protein
MSNKLDEFKIKIDNFKTQNSDLYNGFVKTIFGILTGVINVAIFNPFDRALYLSTKEHGTILNLQYWKAPYQGVLNGIVQRTLSYGLYYPTIDIVNKKLDNPIMSMTVTSGIMGFVTSPLSAIKLTNWNSDHSTKIISFAKQMYVKGGMYPFFRGTFVTLKRDIAFGATLGYLSYTYNPKKEFWKDAIFATSATTISSPFNYLRVIKYKAPCDIHLPSHVILKDLINIIQKECQNYNTFHKIIYTFHHKFNVGWGSLRVGLGMAMSRQLYEFFINNK